MSFGVVLFYFIYFQCLTLMFSVPFLKGGNWHTDKQEVVLHCSDTSSLLDHRINHKDVERWPNWSLYQKLSAFSLSVSIHVATRIQHSLLTVTVHY